VLIRKAKQGALKNGQKGKGRSKKENTFLGTELIDQRSCMPKERGGVAPTGTEETTLEFSKKTHTAERGRSTKKKKRQRRSDPRKGKLPLALVTPQKKKKKKKRASKSA